MLVIVSDLHLTDGTVAPTLSADAFTLLADRLRDLAVRASCRADGTYRPIRHLDLLLLGDVFDLMRSTRWLRDNTRPWHDTESRDVVRTLQHITAGILRNNQRSLRLMRAMAAGHAIAVPRDLRADRDTPGESVPVRIHYMVGNHDWPFHLSGAEYDTLRQTLIEQTGLATRPDRPPAHDPVEDDRLLDVLRRHRVFARHGDLFDPLSCTGDRDVASLNDAILIELVARFVAQIEHQMGSDLPAAVPAGLRWIHDVRPVLWAPIFLEGLLRRFSVRPALSIQIKRCWDNLVDELLQLSMIRDHETFGPIEPAGAVDGLSRALKFARRSPDGWARQTAEWLGQLQWSTEGSYRRHAMAEPEFRNRRARHVVYGHTHRFETVPLDASFADGYVLEQAYFNTGTWRRVFRPTELAPGQCEFVAAESMSILAFFHGDERRGRAFETWSGTLAAAADRPPNYRIDSGRKVHAAEQPVSTSGVHVGPPHYPLSAVEAGTAATDRVG